MGGTAFCDAPAKVFENQNYSCTAAGPCHGAPNTSGLDLVTDPKEALFGKPSATTSTKCPGDPLVATTTPAGGVLFKRLEGDECGPRMPFGLSMSAEDVQCVKDWVMGELTR